MASPPRYQPYLDVAPRPFRWRLGLRPLELADWIQIDQHHAADVARKHRLLTEHHDTVFAALDDVEDESAEVLDALVDHLGTLGRSPVVDRGVHPLDAAGRLVQEDLVLLVERNGELVCGAGSVCFPNRWDLTAKVGRTMDEIHAPVSQLNEHLRDPIDKFLARITPDKSYWRLGWGVLDTDELYQPVDGTAAPRPTDAGPADHHLRVERETLRRFPATRCILFTIRTYICPLDAVTAPADLGGLADAIDGLPGDVARYKQIDTAGSEIAGWLRSLAVTSTA